MGLNEQATILQTSVDLLNDKLDTVITLLGGAPPTPVATLDDLLAVLQDIHLDTISMDGKLLSIRNYMVNPSEEPLEDDYTSLVYNVMWLRRAVAATTFAGSLDYPLQIEQHAFKVLHDSLMSSQTGMIVTILDTLVNALNNIGVNSGASPDYTFTGYLSQVLNWLAKIVGSEGVPIDGGNRNIIELLAKIADRPESQIGSGLLPDQICIDPYASTGMTLVPWSILDGIHDLTFAVFKTTLPTGISYGTIFGLGVDYTELHHTSGNWSGYKIYVASSAANFALNAVSIESSLSRYATNVWIDISFLETNLSVFVNGVDSLKVYLCGDGWGGGGSSGGPWGGDEPIPPDEGECWEISSVAAEYFYNPSFTLDMQVIQFTSVSGVGCTNEHTFTESTEGFDMVCTVALGNFVGWTIEMLTGTPSLTIAMVTDAGSRTTDSIGGSIYTVPGNTASILICNAALGGSAASSPFSIRLCSPVIP